MSKGCSPLPSQVIVELCAASHAACAAAVDGGADRIELCTQLEVGGLTPDIHLVEAAVATSLPVHVLLRPTADTFCYSPTIYAEIAASMQACKGLGVAGFVLGLLTDVGLVDIEHTRSLVELAHPLPVTFHRAFDDVADLPKALEDVVRAGCTRVLTSGGAPDVVQGIPALAALVQQAGDRIEIAVGGGLRLGNAALVASHTRARHFHASLREHEDVPGSHATKLTERLRELVRILREPSPDLYTTPGTGAEPSAACTGR